MTDQYRDQARAHLERLRLSAIDQGMTMQTIADRTGFNQPNVHRMLHGKYIPRYDNYLKLSDSIKKK